MAYLNPRSILVIKLLLHLFLSVPLAVITYGLFTNSLGANPVEALTHSTGEWALRFLLVTLCISPLVLLTKQKWLVKFRRLIGLWCFTYSLLHLLTYFVFDLSLSLNLIVEDIRERPYITVGFCSFTILLALAITSPQYFRKKLGKQWLRLHQLIYVAIILALLHLFWLTKADYSQAWVYASIAFVLLTMRLKVVKKALS